MLLHRKLLSYLILKFMKTLIYTITMIILLATLSSCTADDIETKNNGDSTTVSGAETEPIINTTPPKK